MKRIITVSNHHCNTGIYGHDGVMGRIEDHVVLCEHCHYQCPHFRPYPEVKVMGYLYIEENVHTSYQRSFSLKGPIIQGSTASFMLTTIISKMLNDVMNPVSKHPSVHLRLHSHKRLSCLTKRPYRNMQTQSFRCWTAPPTVPDSLKAAATPVYQSPTQNNTPSTH
jgi:hypothetical protein